MEVENSLVEGFLVFGLENLLITFNVFYFFCMMFDLKKI